MTAPPTRCPNLAPEKLLHQNLSAAPAPVYTPEEQAFALALNSFVMPFFHTDKQRPIEPDAVPVAEML